MKTPAIFAFQEVKKTEFDFDSSELERGFELAHRVAPRSRTYGPGCAPQTAEEKPVCKISERCSGCPYPAHGFVCWNSDGKCLRSRMAEINDIKEKSEHEGITLQ